MSRYFYDLLDPARNWPEFLVRDITKRIELELRAQDQPHSRSPARDATFYLPGDLLLSRRPSDWNRPKFYPSIPRWGVVDATDGEGREGGDSDPSP